MMLKKGDRVEVIDDALAGVVQDVQNDSITIKTEDGFLMNFDAQELVKIEDSLAIEDVSDFDMEQVIRQKTPDKPRRSERIKPKERSASPMEVDLHIHKKVKFIIVTASIIHSLFMWVRYLNLLS